jgi:hypothetical protein
MYIKKNIFFIKKLRGSMTVREREANWKSRPHSSNLMFVYDFYSRCIMCLIVTSTTFFSFNWSKMLISLICYNYVLQTLITWHVVCNIIYLLHPFPTCILVFFENKKKRLRYITFAYLIIRLFFNVLSFSPFNDYN